MSVFIIAEAGSNWRLGTEKRDYAMGKALIDAAKEAGADAVKFQTYKPETVYVPNAGQSDYLSKGGIKEDISSIFSDLAMPYDLIPKLFDYCKSCEIEFMSSPFSPDDFAAVDPFVKRHKIASYEITHLRLLQAAAQSQKPLILSSGASNLDDLRWAISTFQSHGGSDVTVLQCTAQYPAEVSSLNLLAMSQISKALRLPVGLSDHSQDPVIAPVMAVALGATVIEKHYTLSKRLPGPDHFFALDPAELKTMCHAIREAEKMRGSGEKTRHQNEEELANFARRGIQAIRDIDVGERLLEGVNIAILRPGKQKPGLHPMHIDTISGKVASKRIKIGQGLDFDDVSQRQ